MNQLTTMNKDKETEAALFENFKDWYETPHPRTITPELIYDHFVRYFKPEWQKQQPLQGLLDEKGLEKCMSIVYWNNARNMTQEEFTNWLTSDK